MEKVEKKIILPTIAREPVAVNPHVMLLYSIPKAGKTTIVSQLPNSLLIECEPGGADYVKANVINATNPYEFEEIVQTIISEGNPYDTVIVDTVTMLDEWSEIMGTLDYMDKPQGKRFNRNNKGQKLNRTHPEFESVHTLPNGNGYVFSRARMNEWYNLISKSAKHVILLAHVKDKFVESKNGDTVESTDINLTGKVKSNYCIRADAVGHFHRQGDDGFINFDNENSIVCGGRCTHLNGDILISKRLKDKSIETYWDKIYLKT